MTTNRHKRRIIEKIISGGRRGAERAALDTAIETGIAHGGWVPKGRMTEDGILPEIIIADSATSF